MTSFGNLLDVLRRDRNHVEKGVVFVWLSLRVCAPGMFFLLGCFLDDQMTFPTKCTETLSSAEPCYGPQDNPQIRLCAQA